MRWHVELYKLNFRLSCYAAATPYLDGVYGSLQGAYLHHTAYVCDGITANCYAYEGHHNSWGMTGPLHAIRSQVKHYPLIQFFCNSDQQCNLYIELIRFNVNWCNWFNDRPSHFENYKNVYLFKQNWLFALYWLLNNIAPLM